jgi:hypothetical protein
VGVRQAGEKLLRPSWIWVLGKNCLESKPESLLLPHTTVAATYHLNVHCPPVCSPTPLAQRDQIECTGKEKRMSAALEEEESERVQHFAYCQSPASKAFCS